MMIMGKKFEMENNIAQLSWYIFVSHLFSFYYFNGDVKCQVHLIKNDRQEEKAL